MGWMHDTLNYMVTPPWERSAHHNEITFSMYYFYNERYLLALSHDEVVHGKKTMVDKMWGTYDEKFEQVKTLYTYMYTHPGKKLNFMGNEFAEFREWDEKKEQDWVLMLYPKHAAFARFFAKLSGLYVNEAAMHNDEYRPEHFRWLEVNNSAMSTYSYELTGRVEKPKAAQTTEHIIVVLNMSARYYPAYWLPYDRPGRLIELLRTTDPMETDDAIRVKKTSELEDWRIHPVVEDGGRHVMLNLAGYESVILKYSEK